jgi:hypothetical protein
MKTMTFLGIKLAVTCSSLLGIALGQTITGEPAKPGSPSAVEKQRIFFTPTVEKTGYMWDVWVHHHEGKYYLYYLAGSKDREGPGFGDTALAVSEDGVSWREHGVVVPLSETGRLMGSCGVWESKSDDLPTFLMNLMELRQDRGRVMFTLGSEDLVHWEHLGEEYTFGPDPRWYNEKGRWVGISAVPDPEAGYYGYWTASPKGGEHQLFGFGRSKDGAAWEMLPPPEVADMGPGLLRELGGAVKIGDNYYLMLCIYQGEMTVAVGDRPEGPFRLQDKNARFLFGQTHFARFSGGTAEPLVAHHIMASTGLDTPPICYFAPLKRAVVDKHGILRLAYWEGNDRLKTRPVKIELPTEDPMKADRLVMLENRLDVDHGLVLEGSFRDLKAGRFLAVSQGLYIEQAPGRGTAIMIAPPRITQIGAMTAENKQFRMESFVNRAEGYGPNPKFRLLLRNSQLEFYINDRFIQCYSMPGNATGRIGIIHNGDPETIGEVRAWN